MKVVALISGGKDSTFNMMKCIEHGHEIVCLANLYPPQGTGELDSYMYQSVGGEAIEEFATCMQLPLLRRQIKGSPKNLNYEYEASDKEDEVEDLFELLKQVKSEYPGIEAVSSGAIWSSYQKNRVENVCDRLGLVSLAYLWQRDQVDLLAEMIASELHAVLIKVAVGGLDARHLGQSIAQMQPTLLSLQQSMGINVCGEGGEYESLVLDSPLFKKERIELRQIEKVVHRDDPFAPVVYLSIKSLCRVPK